MDQAKQAAPTEPTSGSGDEPTSSPLTFSLDDHVPYLINRVAAIGVRSFSQELARAGITVPMWRVIAVLWSKGEQRQIDLSELTAIEASTLSRLIGVLCRKKLVSRERSSSSTREVTVSLTTHGRVLTENFIPIAVEFENAELRGLSEEQRENFRQALKIVYNNIHVLTLDGQTSAHSAEDDFE